MNVKLGKRTLATQAIIVGVVALFLVSLSVNPSSSAFFFSTAITTGSITIDLLSVVR